MARGKAQLAILQILKSHGSMALTDLAAMRELRGVHFARIQSAAKALAKGGKIQFADDETQMLTLKESVRDRMEALLEGGWNEPKLQYTFVDKKSAVAFATMLAKDRSIRLQGKPMVRTDRGTAKRGSHGVIVTFQGLGLEDSNKAVALAHKMEGWKHGDVTARLKVMKGKGMVKSLESLEQVRAELTDYLDRNGWTVKRGLKIPHATRDDGLLRLWFKPQAVWYSEVGSPQLNHEFKYARTIAYDLDVRKIAPEKLVQYLNKRFP